MNFITAKNIPEEITKKLSIMGNIYKSTSIFADDTSVSFHPDIQIHFVEKDVAICPPNTFDYYKNILPTNINIICGTSRISSTYPSICAYNIARIGKYVICNTKYAEKTILDFYSKKEYKIIHTNQGYAKCNICPISENFLITEDKGILNSLSNEDDIKVLLIEPGNVRLPGFKYGFIGGASGIIENKLLFCGTFPYVKDREKIVACLKEEGVELIELSDNPLCDYGSIIPF